MMNCHNLIRGIFDTIYFDWLDCIVKCDNVFEFKFHLLSVHFISSLDLSDKEQNRQKKIGENRQCGSFFIDVQNTHTYFLLYSTIGYINNLNPKKKKKLELQQTLRLLLPSKKLFESKLEQKSKHYWL